MKIRTLLMALAAFSFMLTACENKANNVENTENQTEEEPTFTADDVNQIGAIISVWEELPIPVAAVEGMSDIKRVANAFCSLYSNYEPNKVICDYIDNPESETENFMVEGQDENGYLACRGMFQYNEDTYCRIWKRENGHQLVGFWLIENSENGDETTLLAFYDIDPDTNIMTPEPELTKKIEEAMAQYDSYAFNMPEEGEDAGVTGYKATEEDSFETTYYILHWNGGEFIMEKSEE